jgi:Tfp pilus assembly protein PilF
MHLMAEIAAKCELREDSERILRESARIHAHSKLAWTNLGMTLHRIACEKDYPDYVHRAVEALDKALALDPQYEPALAYKAAIYLQTRGLDLARAAFEQLVSQNPSYAPHWVNFGYLLKTLGEFGSSVAAYRTAIALDPANGAAWWGFANLKLGRFFKADLAAMESALDGPGLRDGERVEILFALAKALDQCARYQSAAARFDEANKLGHATAPPQADVLASTVELVHTVFTKEFFEERRGQGDPRRDPIFIVGMPRAGSTLVEQILASHPLIEGTEELFVLHQLEVELTRDYPNRGAEDLFRSIALADFERLGARYIELAGRSRRTKRPIFTDKNPANWRFVGLIHCMLPNARIIDVRRNPMDCCFANYAQHFQAGANFTYDQRALGRYYSDYVLTMRHFDDVLPGRVHRLIHDDLVDNLELEVRRLLDYVGVPFNEACLRFHETERAVHTPSSEQVRQPINRAGFGKWRNYEPLLAALKEALGDVTENWRQ